MLLAAAPTEIAPEVVKSLEPVVPKAGEVVILPVPEAQKKTPKSPGKAGEADNASRSLRD